MERERLAHEIIFSETASLLKRRGGTKSSNLRLDKDGLKVVAAG